MSTFPERIPTTRYHDGHVTVEMPDGAVIRFPVADNPRLAHGSDEELGQIEASPFGLHWPALDEDLSFRGLLAGDHGQQTAPAHRPRAART